MNPLMLIKGELRRSSGGILALALVLALSLSLGVGVSMTERAVRQGTARAGDAFDLLVGAQGSSVQLMLGAVYLRPQSLPLVPGGAVTEILTQEGVVWAAPLAFGDRWNASPLVGTTTDMVTLGGNRTLAEGRAFAAQDEAVLGAGVPLRLGEAFSPMHGQVSASHNEHGHVRYKAVGRLPETGTPWDNAILIPIESVWAVHDALPDAGHGLPLGHPLVAALPTAGDNEQVGMFHRILVGFIEPVAQQHTGLIPAQASAQHDHDLLLLGGQAGIPADRDKGNKRKINHQQNSQHDTHHAPGPGAEPHGQRLMPDSAGRDGGGQPPLPRTGHIAVIRQRRGDKAQGCRARQQPPCSLRARGRKPALHPVAQQHLPAREVPARAAQALFAECALQLAQAVRAQKRAAPVRLCKVRIALAVHAQHAPQLCRQRMLQAQVGVLRVRIDNDLPRGAARLRTRTGDAPECVIVVGSGLVHGGLLTLI